MVILVRCTQARVGFFRNCPQITFLVATGPQGVHETNLQTGLKVDAPAEAKR
jgi:hypothetical protein